VQCSAAQRELDTMCAFVYHVPVWRACLQTNPLTQGPCRMAPVLPGIPHWEFFGLFSFFTYYSLSCEGMLFIFSIKSGALLIPKRNAMRQAVRPPARFAGRGPA